MTEPPIIKKFVLKGLHYYQDFEIEFNNSVTILVGENGLGKTTVLNILYSTISCRWEFLSQFGFDSVEIEFFSEEKIFFTHSELDAFIIETETNKIITKSPNTLEYEVFQQTVKGNSVRFNDIKTAITKNLSAKIIYFPVVRLLRESLLFFSRELEPNNDAPNDYSDIENEILMPLNDEYLIQDKRHARLKSDYSNFIKICNKYLVNTKMDFVENSKTFLIKNKISDEIVSYKQLSTGEKQIIFIFSDVFLNNHPNVIVLFDEPELSLSLPWQRTILTDLMSSQKCNLLFAVTHSPFIFDNELDKYAFGINTCFKLK